jgi:hypothetical protein
VDIFFSLLLRRNPDRALDHFPLFVAIVNPNKNPDTNPLAEQVNN